MAVNDLPAKPIPADTHETIHRAVSQYDSALELAALALERGVKNIFLVGCGGSLSAMYPAQYLLESRTSAFATSLLSSAEFTSMRPARLSGDSLVVLSSHTGETPETVDAAVHAQTAGALVAAITSSSTSRLARLATTAFAYGSKESAADAKNVLVSQVALALLEQSGALADPHASRDAWERLPSVLYAAKRESETLSQEIAVRYQDEAVTYVLACGPSYGVGYALAMCYLQEMQWMHASVVNAGEFFHGAFEVITDETPVLVLLDETEARPIAERALRFAQRYSRKAIAVDSRDLSLPGVISEYRPLLSPFALGAATTRIAANLAAVRSHPLDTRRYMFHVPY